MKIEAGKALDLLVSEKVMGYTILTQEEMKAEAVRVWKEQPNCMHFMVGFRAWKDDDGQITCEQKCLNYSTKIEDAWEVKDKIGRLMRLEDYGPYGWACEFLAVQPGQEDVIAKADTAPLAICAAALLAVQKKEKEKTIERCEYCGTGENLSLCLGSGCSIYFCLACAGSHSRKHVRS